MNGYTVTSRILLVDLSQREAQQRSALANQKAQLEAIQNTASTSGGLTSDQATQLAAITANLDSDITVDPFYQAVATTYDPNGRTWAELVAAQNTFVHMHGLMPSQQYVYDANGSYACALTPDEQAIVAICGLLELDSLTDTTMPRFTRKIAAAQGEYRDNKPLFDAAFSQLSAKYEVTLQSQIDQQLVDAAVTGCVTPGGSISQRQNYAGHVPLAPNPVGPPPETILAVSAKNLAAVVRRLADGNVTAQDPWLQSRISNSFDMQTGVVNGAPPSSTEINLPDLEEDIDVEIVTQNLHAIQGLHYSNMLEEAGLYRVVEKIVDLFRQRLLPLGRGSAGDYLYTYYKKAAERMTEAERRDLYMGAFGVPGGNPNPASAPNKEFPELWMRFVSAVSNFARQLTIEKLLRNALPMAVTQEQVRKSGRDLAANLSVHGYGIAYFAAIELQTNILEFRDLLSDRDILTAFAARDMWQVIDQVNTNYLGGPRNSNRYRTQARAGAIIIRWLANNHDRLSGTYGTDVISVASLTNPQLRALGSAQPMVDPTDWDLVQSCEQYLAVGGVQEERVEQYSQPIESPIITSKPVEVPSIVQDALSSVGVSLPAA
jgi:hypothetical protein